MQATIRRTFPQNPRMQEKSHHHNTTKYNRIKYGNVQYSAPRDNLC